METAREAVTEAAHQPAGLAGHAQRDLLRSLERMEAISRQCAPEVQRMRGYLMPERSSVEPGK